MVNEELGSERQGGSGGVRFIELTLDATLIGFGDRVGLGPTRGSDPAVEGR